MKRIGLTLLILCVFLLVIAILSGIVVCIEILFSKYDYGKYWILVPLVFFVVSVYRATGDFYKQKENEKSRNQND